MRWDLTGVLWDDYVAPREKKEKILRTPPDPVWLNDDYLPNLEEARACVIDELTGPELYTAVLAGDEFFWDWEFYPNYVVGGGKHIKTGKIFKVEFENGNCISNDDYQKLEWFARNALVIGFNDQAFDIPMVHAILAGFDTYALMDFVNLLILGDENGNQVYTNQFYKKTGINEGFKINSIDLIELTPLSPGLKKVSGRIHAKRMQELPFKPGKELTDDQKIILRWYWMNDLANTEHLYETHKPAIELRKLLGAEYNVDVRSKSDPQIAEEVIKAEIKRLTGQKWFKRATIEPGRQFNFIPPAYVKFRSPTLQWVLNFIREQKFTIAMDGTPVETEALSKLVFGIGKAKYKMGIGGLHSREKKAIHIAGDRYEISDNDVTSYYPYLILQQGMYPPNIGPVFLEVFRKIVERRVFAKESGDKGTAETLKIVINGTFGKTGERGGRSIVYYPEMMIQVTLSGQLSLLMLIEAFEMNGIEVISANTDGITVKCPIEKVTLKNKLIEEWQDATGLNMESKFFKAVYSRDVNNYIALLDKPDKKEEGAYQYAKAIGAYRKVTGAYPPKWNPSNDICKEALIMYLAQDVPMAETITACKDIRKFLTVREVKGGGVKDGVYLGKAVRWYHATEADGEIVYANSGNKVSKSEGAKPCMELPAVFPDDIDYDYYIRTAEIMYEKIAA